MFRRYKCAHLNIIEYLEQAADTIEALSAKLAATNMERSERYYWLNEIMERLEFKTDEANDKILASNFEDDKNYYDGKEDGIRLAIDLIKSLEADKNAEWYYGGGWIPVGDKLPEACKTVMAFIKPRDISLVYFAIDNTWRFAHDDEFVKDVILAWQPLPPDYQPKE